MFNHPDAAGGGLHAQQGEGCLSVFLSGNQGIRLAVALVHGYNNLL